MIVKRYHIAYIYLDIIKSLKEKKNITIDHKNTFDCEVYNFIKNTQFIRFYNIEKFDIKDKYIYICTDNNFHTKIKIKDFIKYLEEKILHMI